VHSRRWLDPTLSGDEEEVPVFAVVVEPTSRASVRTRLTLLHLSLGEVETLSNESEDALSRCTTDPVWSCSL